MPFELTPTMLRLSAGIPTAGVGGLLGYLTAPKKYKWDGAARGAGAGYIAGTGLGVGAELGSRASDANPTAGMIAGGLTGGLLGTGVGQLMQGEPEWEKRRKFREELLSVVREETDRLKNEEKHQSVMSKYSGHESNDQLPALTRFATNYPGTALVPLSAIVGGALAQNTKRPLTDFARGATHGGLTGLGALAGGAVGSHLTTNPVSGSLIGGGLGGLISYLSSRRLLRQIYSDPDKEKTAAGPVLSMLIQAKRLSDKRDYGGKHQRLRQLIEKYPDDFFIDSDLGEIVGLTHSPTHFRIHAPKNVLPPVKLRRFDDTPIAKAA